jgi:hypothetical protein
MRGGEKVLLSLARLFPAAPIFTLLHVKGSLCPELEAREIRTTFVQRLPGVATRYRQYLPLFPAAAASIDLAGFDLVVSSSHCVAKGVKPAPGALHICYCHTPMRYVWDRYDDYFGPGRVRGPALVFAEGGGLESVVPGETGLLFSEATPQALRAAVDSLEGLRFNSSTLRSRAETYRREVFEARISAFVDQALAEAR